MNSFQLNFFDFLLILRSPEIYKNVSASKNSIPLQAKQVGR